MREKILFDEGWLFHKGGVTPEPMKGRGPIYHMAKTERKKQGPACIYYNDAVDDFRTDVEFNSDKWTWVNLPHDYIISGEVSEQNNPALGFFDYCNGWYRKHFTVDEADRDKRLTLYFEGVCSRCIVYLNGCELKHNHCSYVPFEVEINDFVKYGEDNVLAVYCYFDGYEGWWYQGGGIYRHVWLNKTAPLCVDLYGVYAAPVCDNGKWRVDFETTLVNDNFSDESAKIITRIIDKDGNEVVAVSADLAVPLRERATAKYSVPVENPTLWDTDNPYLYDIVTDIVQNGDVVDTYKTRTGFRTIRFDAKEGFFLNGKKTIINGVCGHGDFGFTGRAVPDNIFRYKTKMMKEMGANGYRCSHYPQADAAMDSFDEQGMLVMCETRWFDSSDDGKEQLITHIKRDRNRPSVIMWSLGNEEPLHTTDIGRRINKDMYYIAKKLDKYRAITSAVSNDPSNAQVYDEADTVGINYNHWSWDEVHKNHPDKPVYISECCATGTTRGWYHDDCPEKARNSAYDADANSWWTGREHFYQMFKEHDYLFGFFQWIAFEHRGEAMWPRVCSISGAIDLFLQKKDAFYQNKAYFSDEPTVHLLPHWNHQGLEGEPIKVFAYTSCEEVELILNGKTFSRDRVERYTHAEWQVPYEPGVLECVGYIGGKRAAYDCVKTSGKAVALKLHLDNAGDITANGEDIAMITCTCVDENGVEVPNAAPTVSFNCNTLGSVVGTGSDNTDHVPVTSTVRKMYAGAIGVAVKVGKEHGELKVFAESDGLDSAVIKFDI